MSPEQAKGKEIDPRSDVWAFGVLLWEMLKGRKLFEGETASDVLAAVLTREVDRSALPRSTPPAVRRILRRALERNPGKRLQAMGEAHLLLPDDRGLVFTVHRGDAGNDTIELFAGGTRRTLLRVPGERLRRTVYSRTGYLLYERETTNPGIWAVPFSLERMETTGAPFLLAAGGRSSSEGGRTLAFMRADESPVELLRLGRDGRVDSAATITESR